MADRWARQGLGPVIRRPRLVYFDRSALDGLVRDADAGGGAEERVRDAVASGEISIAASHLVIDETLPLLEGSVEVGSRHVNMLLELFDWKRGVIRAPVELVRNQVSALLSSDAPPTAFESADRANSFLETLSFLARSEPEVIARGSRTIREQKERFHAEMSHLRHDALIAKRNVTSPPPKLDATIKELSPVYLRSFLSCLGFRSLSDEDVRRIMDCPAPRMYAGLQVAYVFFQVVEQWAPDLGDSYDLLHGVSATAADEFVSCDKRLRRLAQAAGVGRPNVLSLEDFMRTL